MFQQIAAFFESIPFFGSVPFALIAMVVVRKKVMEHPEQKDGAKHPARIPISRASYNALRKEIAPTALDKGRLDAFRFFFADQLMNGDLQPAPSYPCGACRQVMAQYETKFGKPIKVLVGSKKKIQVFENVSGLLPFVFTDI